MKENIIIAILFLIVIAFLIRQSSGATTLSAPILSSPTIVMTTPPGSCPTLCGSPSISVPGAVYTFTATSTAAPIICPATAECPKKINCSGSYQMIATQTCPMACGLAITPKSMTYAWVTTVPPANGGTPCPTSTSVSIIPNGCPATLPCTGLNVPSTTTTGR